MVTAPAAAFPVLDIPVEVSAIPGNPAKSTVGQPMVKVAGPMKVQWRTPASSPVLVASTVPRLSASPPDRITLGTKATAVAVNAVLK